MSQYSWGNCPAAVREQVGQLKGGLQTDLAGNLIGIYLHGSLAAGCFNPARSDVDLLAVTHRPLTVETKRDLAGLLLEVSLRPSPIEISCLRHADMIPWRYPTPFDFHYSETHRGTYVRELDNGAWKDWNAIPCCDEDLAAHITVTRRRGICLVGPAIPEVFPLVPERDFLASVLGDVLSAEFGLSPAMKNPAYAILNACRTLAYLRTGEILSKDEGGVWALQTLPGRFHPPLVAALAAYRDCADDRSFSRKAAADFAMYLRGELETWNVAVEPLGSRKDNCKT